MSHLSVNQSILSIQTQLKYELFCCGPGDSVAHKRAGNTGPHHPPYVLYFSLLINDIISRQTKTSRNIYVYSKTTVGPSGLRSRQASEGIQHQILQGTGLKLLALGNSNGVESAKSPLTDALPGQNRLALWKITKDLPRLTR